MAKPVASVEEIANYIIVGNRHEAEKPIWFWGKHNITYNMQAFDPLDRPAIRSAFEAWARVANITFTEVAGYYLNEGYNPDADIVLATNGPAPDGTPTPFAQTLNNPGHQDDSVITSAYINISSDWAGGTFQPGSRGYKTLLHEIGHALGLGHSGPYNNVDWTKAAEQSNWANDTLQFSIMSYIPQVEYQSSYNPLSYPYPVTPMMADIVAVQAIYGPSLHAADGDTTYGYFPTSGGYSLEHPLTIYDTNGYFDTINETGSSVNAKINLQDGSFSSLDGGVNNVCIAKGTIIEDALGGSGDDEILGNEVFNILSGQDGNDSLSGLGGNDALFGGPGDDRLDGGDGIDSLDGGEGIDTATYAAEPAGIYADLVTGNVTTSTGVDALTNIENLEGSSFDDTLLGDAGPNTLDGGVGDDTLSGNGGNNILYGGDGTDTAVFTGAASQYHLFRNSPGNYTILSPSGAMDQLISVEKLKFGLSVPVDIESTLDDYPGAISTIGSLLEGESVTAAINVAGDIDWFRTSLTAGTTYWFDDEGSSTSRGTLRDPYMRLLGTDGATVLASNDDGGAGYNAFLSYTPSISGVYFVSAQAIAVSGSSTGTYTLGLKAADDYVSGPATAGKLLTSGDLDSAIDYGRDTDWFRTTLTAGTTYWFNEEGSATSQGTLKDPYMRLLGDDGVTVLASNDDGGTGHNAAISYTPSTTGTYFVSAQAVGSGIGSYHLSERVADDYASSPATTGVLAAGDTVQGTYDFVADTDWFRISLTAGMTYRFDAESTPTGPGTQIHPMLRLFGDHGVTEVASNLSAGQSGGSYSASLSYMPMISSTYYISVGSYGTNVGTYHLSEVNISGATLSPAAGSRMSFIADASPAATDALGAVMTTPQSAGNPATSLLSAPNAEAVLPDYFPIDAGSVTQPQYAVGASTPLSAASFITTASDHMISDVSATPHPFT